MFPTISKLDLFLFFFFKGSFNFGSIDFMLSFRGLAANLISEIVLRHISSLTHSPGVERGRNGYQVQKSVTGGRWTLWRGQTTHNKI